MITPIGRNLTRKLIRTLPVALLGVALSAQRRVTIKVDVSRPMGRFDPVWAWVAHDEPNYTYSYEGRQLLLRLSQLSPHPVHDRTHNLLTSGDGTPAPKWGSNADLQTFLRRNVGLSQDQITAMRDGQPVAKTMPSRTPAEVVHPCRS